MESIGIKTPSADVYLLVYLHWRGKPWKEETLFVYLTLQKKTTTILNPAAASAGSFEEAEDMIHNIVPIVITNKINDQPEYITYHVPGIANPTADKKRRFLKIPRESIIKWPQVKWPVKLFFYYLILAFCAAAAGVLITFLLGLLV